MSKPETISELGLLKSPVEITVENRYVSEIKGERADELKTILEGAGKLAYNLAELGFGLRTYPKSPAALKVIHEHAK